jgi:Asp-tRNA(Asn)/Glu-tRNA(Gln) amidotransferase C subunit
MTDISTKIKNLEKALKIKVEDEQEMSKNFESIINMFDELKNIDVEKYNSSLKRKRIRISDLRKDESSDGNFLKDLHGNYIQVPSVIQK